MPNPTLTIHGSGQSWAIYQGAKLVSRFYTTRDNAIAAEAGVLRRLTGAAKHRICCCGCGEMFMARPGEMRRAECRKRGRRHG